MSVPGGISVLSKTVISLMMASWWPRMNALTDMLCSSHFHGRWPQAKEDEQLNLLST